MKILSIGNSFAEDTMTLLPEIAKDLGIDGHFAYLYIPGCPIAYHYANAVDNLPVYRYTSHNGIEWNNRVAVSIKEAIQLQDWDWINIQHGSKDRHRYTSAAFYTRLSDLVSYVKNIAPTKTKISFNMAWVADPEKEHHEMVGFFDNDQEKMHSALVKITLENVATTNGIDKISPTGIAIQEARRLGLPDISRDNFHLSYGFGRYLAALTFLKSLTDADIEKINWAPEGVNDELKTTAIKCALSAVDKWQKLQA